MRSAVLRMTRLNPPRSTEQRKADILAKFTTKPGTENDVWVASASASGSAYLIPLSFYWDGSTLTVATVKSSQTARNLTRAGRARMAIGPTRDVVILEGTLEIILEADVDDKLGSSFASATGFDPRQSDPEYVYIRMKLQKVQAWREENELAGRDIMKDGEWLA